MQGQFRFVVALAVSPVCGCASIMGGSISVVTFTAATSLADDAEEIAATVVLDGQTIGTTPFQHTFQGTKPEREIVVQADGFHDRRYRLVCYSRAAVVGNILFGGVVGLLVDSASGSSTRYPKEAHFIMIKESAHPPPEADLARSREAQRKEALSPKGDLDDRFTES